MHPNTLQIADFDYALPEDRIAKFPLANRESSKLLIYRKGEITESVYHHLPELIPPNSTLVFNNTRVLEARLLFTKESGGTIEIFTLEPAGIYPNMETALSAQQSVEWICLVGGASKWKPHIKLQKTFTNGNDHLILEAELINRLPDAFTIRFSWTPGHYTFPEILQLAGQIPLPPYLNREPVEADDESYQTVYASRKGSVAAPTAGLHFTTELLEKLQQKNITLQYLTLHVGAGTFRPVKSETIGGHAMHSEYIDVDKQLIRAIAQNSSGIYAIGTTSLRTLESLYWLGVKCHHNPRIKPEQLNLGQWEPYEHPGAELSCAESLTNLGQWMDENALDRLISHTRILIAPGYRFRVIRGLVTNFHQPKSTLLLLIAAMLGNEWKRVYAYALEHDFRFLSYGDGCLLEL